MEVEAERRGSLSDSLMNILRDMDFLQHIRFLERLAAEEKRWKKMLGSTSKRFLIFNAIRLEWNWSESWKNQKEFCLYSNISEQGLLVSPELTEKTNTKRLAHFVCLHFGLCSKWLRESKLYKPQFRSSFIEVLIMDAKLNVWWSQRNKVCAKELEFLYELASFTSTKYKLSLVSSGLIRKWRW